MKNRKSNRLKGYDYSKNNLYFITNCVKNNFCCFGRVVPVGTGRDLSVLHASQNHASQNHSSQNNSSVNQHPKEKYEVELNQYGIIVQEKINWLMS